MTDLSRRGIISLAAATGATLILPGVTKAVPSLQPSILPIGTIIATMDSTWNSPGYKILADGNYWLPLWMKNYYLQVRQFPVLFSMLGYTYGRRDLHNSVYGPEGEFALPYYVGSGEAPVDVFSVDYPTYRVRKTLPSSSNG